MRAWLCVLAACAACAACTEAVVLSSGNETSTVVATVYGPASKPTLKFGVADCSSATALACGRFVDAYNASGWGRLYVSAADKASPADGAFGVGYVEGSLTQRFIWIAFTNYFRQFFGSNPKPPAAIEEWTRTQYNWVKGQVALRASSQPYWASVKVLMAQYDGLAAGYSAVAPSNEAMSDVHFMYLQMDGDMETVQEMFGSGSGDMQGRTLNKLRNERCSVLVRATDTNLFMSHDTWDGYEAMVRIFKHYTLDMPNPDTGDAMRTTVSLSGTPGYLSSVDDYYLTSQGLYVSETTNGIYNNSLYAQVKNTDALLSWMRCMLATYTSTTGKQWAHTFARYNSGTYNNQWMVVTLDLVTPGTSSSSPTTMADGAFWVTEQLPGYVESADQTAALRTNGYWGSYNIPFYPKVYAMSGFQAMFDKHGNAYSHEHCPRANIFRRDAPGVSTMSDFQRVMQHNEWQTDPLQLGSAANGIMSRYDLVSPDGDAFGGIDSKVTDYALAKAGTTLAMNGPTHLTQVPFKWTAKWDKASHLGQPLQFDYTYQTMAAQKP